MAMAREKEAHGCLGDGGDLALSEKAQTSEY